MPRVTTKNTKKPRRHAGDVERRLAHLYEQSEEEHAARLAHKVGLPYIDLHLLPLSSDDILTIPEETARDLKIASILTKGKMIKIATSQPQDARVKAYVEELEQKRGWHVTLVVVSPASLRYAWAQYKNVVLLDTIDAIRINLSEEDLKTFEQGIGRLLKLKGRIDTLPTTELLSIIFAGAVALRASDVHLEPEKDDVRLRYRIDGVLQDVVRIPFRVYKSILSRIKLMGKMKINIRDRAQDGHFSFESTGAPIDVRVSTIPSKIAEGLVMRLLDSRGIHVGLDELGLMGKAYEDLVKNITKNTGMILTTGPTGSGKTTTLYTVINHIKSETTKIITIEDPIEYDLPGIVQTEVSKDKNYTFAKGLRAIVRQDPDVILVGEIRDDETADIAINAALTGHLVFSTLHTNNAPATVARLLELGVRPNLIPPSTNIFMAQRLVRTLCSCKESYVPAEQTKEAMMKMLSLISPKAKMPVPKEIDVLYKPKGCVLCHGSGFKGRIGIFEVLTMSERVEKLILEMAGETEIMKDAIEDGFVTMTQDGVLKALAGTTTMGEVWRVTAESDIIEDLYESLMAQSLSRHLFVSTAIQQTVQQHAHNPKEMNATIHAATTEDILAILFAYGIHLRASDIHIEPQQDDVFIRMRIDGVLQTIATISMMQYPFLLNKIKNLANIPTTVRQGVSDSRFGVLQEHDDGTEEKMDVRVSIIVGGFGETVVMRLLNRAEVNLDIKTLGFRPYNMDLIMQEATKPHGMLLNTGPTGSGKTTTLYSVLRELNSPSVKIITIEDPIEYQLDGILQTQIDKEHDYTFAKALRALLRQDPDILLVGEIRDEETASTAVNAALTGHLLISTLHTNNAVGAVQRLLNLGVRADDITTSVNAFIAQRLVRKLCSCKKEVDVSPKDKALLEKVRAGISPKVPHDTEPVSKIFVSQGCALCNGIGYKGRTVVSEVLVISPPIRNLIARGALTNEIAEAAVENGMITMEQDAVLKVIEGETTLDEARRVTML